MSVVNSPIQDLLIRIKNGYMARRKETRETIYSNFKKNVLDVLKKYSFIKDYEILEKENNKKFIKVYLNEVNDPVNDVPTVKFYSKPSVKWYLSYKDIKPVAGWRGIGIMTTNQWIISSNEAKANKVGGELIAEIY